MCSHNRVAAIGRFPARGRIPRGPDLDSAAGRSVVPISIDDWFLKSNEFRLWLREEKCLNLFEMETAAGKKLFQEEFVPAWNGSKLWAK
eukprot:SAG25_NODE_723_length_5722_cov_7.544905_5_plen_89_part_00